MTSRCGDGLHVLVLRAVVGAGVCFDQEQCGERVPREGPVHGDASAGVGAGGRCDRSKMELLIRQVNAKKLPFACLSVYGTNDCCGKGRRGE